jgi:acetyl-CoA carboxylase biotin carboxyl carrier protein
MTMAAKRSTKKKSTTKKKPAAARKPAPKKVAKKAAAKPPRRKLSAREAAAAERLDQLQRLVDMMVDKDVVEVELEEAGARWRVRRSEPHAVAYTAAPSVPMAAAAPAAAAPASAAPAADAAPAEPQGEVFTSPMLGTFYAAPSPDAENFVKVGDRVSADTTLCIVEAMKVMNEIKAEREFEVLEVLVKNGEPVEFGQPLFLIR